MLRKLWLDSLRQFQGRTIFLKGNEQQALIKVEGYLLFLLQENGVKVRRKDDDFQLIDKVNLALRCSYEELRIDWLSRYFLSILTVDKRLKLTSSDLISIWWQWKDQNFERTLRYLNLLGYASLKSPLNLQEQLLRYVTWIDFLPEELLISTSTINLNLNRLLRIRYNNMIYNRYLIERLSNVLISAFKGIPK